MNIGTNIEFSDCFSEVRVDLRCRSFFVTGDLRIDFTLLVLILANFYSAELLLGTKEYYLDIAHQVWIFRLTCAEINSPTSSMAVTT